MDIVTHGLASLAVARAFFPRAGKAGIASALIAGTLADIDWLSAFFGPSAFFGWHGTYTHSILATVLISAVFPAILVAAIFWGWLGIDVSLPRGEAIPNDPRTMRNLALRNLFGAALLAPLCAALLHIAMDACQSDGVALLWPFRDERIAADWLPGLDPWILVILIAAMALPELLHLVSSEIGAKEKRPRGQRGAIIGLAFVLVYVGARATLHSNAVAMLQARTYRSETPRRVGAFPESVSLLTWQGIVETESALHEIAVDVTVGGSFNPESGVNLYKPEPSSLLEAARNTAAAKAFLRVARFPKAAVQTTAAGYVVELRDLRYAAVRETQHEIAVVVELDSAGKVTSESFVWARDLHR